MDIATLLETHRKHMLELAATYYDKDEEEMGMEHLQALERLHDRATTKTALDLHRDRTAPPVLAPTTSAPKSRTIKPGSKAAKARALKAQETRRRNLQARQQEDAQVAAASPSVVGAV